MGNSQSFCQAAAEQHSEETTRTVEEVLSGEPVPETGGSFIPDSVTVKSSNQSQQGKGTEDEDDDVFVVSAEDVQVEIEEENNDQEEEEEEEKKYIVLHTAPIDPRFSGTNAARYCYVAYNEYHKCAKEKGEDNKECQAKARTYRSICPDEWISRWNELREEGTWFGKY